MRPEVLQEAQGPLPAALLLLILHRDVQLGDLRGAGRDSHASSLVETGMSGNFLSCSKGVKDPLEVTEVRCD